MYNKEKGYQFLFGPVPSRRLGRSLGVDIIPAKVCSLNCIYCEVGKTTSCIIKRQRFYNPDDVIAELIQHYEFLKDGLDVITITGAGEPTLCSDIGYIIDEIKKFSDLPIAVLTNSTLFTDENVQKELMNADIVVPSIDAATQEAFKKVCSPETSLDIEAINRSIIEFSHKYKGRLLIEILLCEGMNDSSDEICKIAGIIEQCEYEIVQLNTVHRPPAFVRAKPVSAEYLLDTALYLKSRGIKVESIGNYIKDFKDGSLTTDELKRLLVMRPCSVMDISLVFGVSIDEVAEKLKGLTTEQKTVGGETFYYIR